MNTKAFLLAGLLLFACFSGKAQKHINKCKLEIISAEPQTISGKTRWYKLVIQNNNELTLDALEWEAHFYNKFNNLIGVKKGDWSSGDFIDPISPGKKLTSREITKDLGDADRVYIHISRAHFVGNKTCN